MTTYRRKPDVRKEEILTAAMVVAERDGFINLQRETVASQAQCSTGSVNRYFGNMNQLRIAVMRRAVKKEVLPIVAQGLSLCNSHALKASDTLKQAAIQSISSN